MSDVDVIRKGGKVVWHDHVYRQRTSNPEWTADLREADLRREFLPGVDLRGADLTDSRLDFADLREADLSGADLTRASCYFTRWDRADLRGARYSPLQMLQCNFSGPISDDLCVQLMALDADALPRGTERMDAWARGDAEYPYDDEDAHVVRPAIFVPREDLWPIGGPRERWTIWEIWQRLAAEKGVRI